MKRAGMLAATALRPVIALAVLAILSACNAGSVTDGLTPTAQMRQTPAAPVGNEIALAPQPQASAAPQGALAPQTGVQQPSLPQRPGAPQQNASLGGPVSPVSFLPVTGAPQSAVSSLASSMRQAAQRETIPVVVSVEQGARYQIKGYFSALNDGNGAILVYVWDVLDKDGTRVHRISGQERGSSSPGDPWAGITPAILERVATVTMSSLRTWMSTRNAD